MRILHLADLHIDDNATLAGKVRRSTAGLNQRMTDLVNAIGQIAYAVGDTPPDGVVIAGDLYDHASPTPVEEEIAAAIIDMLASVSREGRVLIIDGNHDCPRGTGAAATASATWHPKVLAVHDPMIVDYAGLKIGCLPYPRTGGNAKLLEDGAMDLIATTLRAQGASVLLAHANTGRATAGKQPRPVDDHVTLSHPVLDQFDAAWLGHIHRPQAWGPVAFCGSPLIEDWGETDGLERGAMLWTLGDGWTHEMIATTGRKWVDIKSSEFVEDFVDTSGSAVHRVKGLMSASEAAVVRASIRSLRQKGAIIQDEIEVASENRVRCEGIERALTDDQIIESALKLKQPDPAVVAGAMREVRIVFQGGAS